MLNWRDDGLETPLHIAVSRGNDEVTKFLIDEGADVNSRSSRSGTVLNSFWCGYGWSKKVPMLRLPLDHGVAVKGEDCLTDFFRARNLFTYVADRFELLAILLEHGALVTPDHLPLAFLWKPEDFNTLLKTHSELTARGAGSLTACILYHKDMHQSSALCINVKILLAHLRSLGHSNDDIFGPDPIYGKTPFCAKLPHTMVEVLVEEGGDINCRDRDGVHPIFCSSPRRNLRDWEIDVPFWLKQGVKLSSEEVGQFKGKISADDGSLFSDRLECLFNLLNGLQI